MHPKYSGIPYTEWSFTTSLSSFEHRLALARPLSYLRHFVLERKTVLPHCIAYNPFLAFPREKEEKKSVRE